jgi:predicted XRE-type DNA-binding protein
MEVLMPGGRPRSDVKQRFLAKVKEMESGCHEWQAGQARGGYGKFTVWPKTTTAHRVAYELFVAPIPEGKSVLHRCDNRLCVNPDHLFIGDSADNVKDMDQKQRRGTKSQLTYADVEQIKQMLADRFSQQVIAEKFGVHQGTISRIKLGKTTLFKH